MENCTFCESIPDYLAIETLQVSERLPEAVEKLILVTRHIRKCPDCGSFFEFNYEQDMALGYTDESIERIKPEHLQEILKEHVLNNEMLIHKFSERDDEWAKYTVEEAQKDSAALLDEINVL